MNRFPLPFVLVALLGCYGPVAAQSFVANYDETQVPAYELPDPLRTESGQPVDSPQQWEAQRRGEILDLFRSQVFGRSPDPISVEHRIVGTDRQALGGKAIRRDFDVTLRRGDRSLTFAMLVYSPQTDEPVPAFLGLNFQGNHTIEADPAIRITSSWVRARNDGSTAGNQALAAGRGIRSAAWPVEMIIDRGYGLATIYYGDIDPDFDDGFENGIHPLFADWAESVEPGQRWGSIAGWAYGLSRALDVLDSDPRIDGSRVAVIGHSRLGKTSLWAGASDERFKLVISNNSGCGGAALSRRAFGETVGRINTAFPHWFCRNHHRYNENESELPVDHHQLLALIAPRAVYVASASEDLWADPRGEFLACVHADPVYRLLGTDGLGGEAAPEKMPAADQPLLEGSIGYHLRSGGHALTEYDWSQYLTFADRHL